MTEIQKKWRRFAEGHTAAVRWIYMTVTAIALLTSLGLVLVMVFSRENKAAPAQPRPWTSAAPPAGQERVRSITLSFSDDEATDLLTFALRGKLPLSDFFVTFSEPDRILINGKISKSDIALLAGREGTASLKTALLFLPESIDVGFVFTLLEDGGSLSAVPEEATVGGVSALEFLPRETAGILRDAISALIPDGTEISKIEIKDGAALVEVRIAG